MSTTTQVEAALDLLAGLVLEDGRRWGEAAADFQWQDAHAVLDPASAQPYSFLTRARGGAKTSDLGGMAIVSLLAQLPPGSRLYGLAADRDQGTAADRLDPGLRNPHARAARAAGSLRRTEP